MDHTLRQAIVVVKAICNAYGVTPVGVELVEGTFAEEWAWQKEAQKYLRAKQRGVKYKPEGRDLMAELEME